MLNKNIIYHSSCREVKFAYFSFWINKSNIMKSLAISSTMKFFKSIYFESQEIRKQLQAEKRN